MKKSAVHSRSGIFLMEIIIAILFFSLVSAVCLQAFVKAHTMSIESATLNKAISLTSSMAEIAQSAVSQDEAIDIIAKEYDLDGSDNTAGGSIMIGFDKTWKKCDTQDDACEYILQADCSYLRQGSNTEYGTSHLTSWKFCVVSNAVNSEDLSTLGSDYQNNTIYELPLEVYYGK